MPSATNPEYSMASPSARKRRREDDEEAHMSFNSTFEASQNLLSSINNNERLIVSPNRSSASPFGVPRKTNHPLPVSKRFRLFGDGNHGQSNNHYTQHSETSSPLPPQSHFSHAHPELVSSAGASSSAPHLSRPAIAGTRTNSSALLSPCHICHRKPTKRSDLDSFADCMGCGERACFVCLRACPGWLPDSQEEDAADADTEDASTSFITMRDVDDEDKMAEVQRQEQQQQQRQRRKGEGGEGGWSGRGHRGVVCSRCCVERGSEGDVVCLGCLAGMRGA